MRFTGCRRLNFFILTVCLLLGTPQMCHADLVSAGDIAFIGFNMDGNDDFAIVLLADAAVGNVVHFNDNEWVDTGGGNTDFNGTSEGEITWTVNSALAAGSVVTFSNVRTGPTASSGTMTGGLMSLSASEAIYAFTGTNETTPTTFLAAFSNDEQLYNGTLGTLTGTGLTQGSTAVLVARSGGDPADGGQYKGVRSGEAAFSDYRSLIGNTTSNWNVDYLDGTQFVPFDSTMFTTSVTSTPEPGSLGLMAWGAVSAFLWRRRGARSRLRSAHPRFGK